MMRFVFYFIVIISAFILHNTVGAFFKLGKVVPDVTLIALVSIALIENQAAGASSGFLAGLLKDLISLRGFGVNAFTHTLIGYVAGIIEASIISNILAFMLLVFGFTILSNFFYMMVAFLVSYQIDYLFWWYALIAAFYNALISPLVYLPVVYAYNKLLTRSSVTGATAYAKSSKIVGGGKK
ncbi:MAG: rod shape-determining protein MreD [Actinobacteria bacterium]|nr:MAG: rod shape-determining protein MreD [Actinomycetota bacterium]